MRLKEHGFTLIEILVVVTILAIAAVIAVPALSGSYDSVRVPAAARMVMSDLLYAQNTAITQQKPVYVVLRKDGSAYTGYDLGVDALNPTARYIPPSQSNNWVSTGGWAWTSDRGEWITRFGKYGDGTTAPGALRSTQLLSVLVGNASVTSTQTIGFDTLGEPIIHNGTSSAPAATPITFEVANSKGDSTAKLVVSPITGEMSIAKPGE